MVEGGFNRSRYIGGSDANMIYMDYGGKTFRMWWAEKLTGIRRYVLDNIHLRAGTVLESEIADELGIPLDARGIRVTPKKGEIAGVNTDALETMWRDGKECKILHEIKTALYDSLFKWLHAKDGVSINYRRQCLHGMYVTGAELALVHVLPMTIEEKENPFLCRILAEKIHTFRYTRDDFDFVEHGARLDYLTHCFNEHLTPTNEGLEFFKNR